MTTANVLVTTALKKITVLGAGKTMSASESADGLAELNRMIDSWAAGSKYIPYETRETLSISTSKNEYSIGSGGDFNTTRPEEIKALTLYSGNEPYPVTLRGRTAYNRTNVNSGEIPEFAWYRPVHPLGLINFSSKPSTSLSLVVDSVKALTTFATIDTDNDMPKGFDDMIIYLLAKRLAPEFGKTLTPEMRELIQEQEDILITRQMNLRDKETTLDSGITASQGHYNVINDR